MMGTRQVDQAALFYEFSLERHVPASHLLRSIERFVDLSGVRNQLAPFYSSAGRPSIDPEPLSLNCGSGIASPASRPPEAPRSFDCVFPVSGWEKPLPHGARESPATTSAVARGPLGFGLASGD